jgi:hypothetical protein
MKLTHALAAVTLAAAAVTGMGPAAHAATVHHHRKPWYCTVQDYGNIRTEPSGKSYICQPANRADTVFTWQLIRGRVES